MGLLDLIRPVRAGASRPRIALLLVLATLLAEVVDVVGGGHPGVGGAASVSGAEALASLLGLLTAAVAGRLVAGDGRWGGSGRSGALHATGPRRVARTAAVLATALVGALLVHETAAMLLHAGHGEHPTEVLAHVGAAVVPVAAVLGIAVALLISVRVVRRVVARRRVRAPFRRTVVAGPGRRPAVRRVIAPAALLRALRIAGRAPPVGLPG